jgi:subtilisin family serine protease
MMGSRALVRGLPWGLALCGLVLGALPHGARAQDVVRRETAQLPSFLGYVPDEFVVMFKPSAAHQLRALQPQANHARANLQRVQTLLDRVGAERFRMQFAGAKPQPVGGRFPDLTGYYLVKLPVGSNLENAMAEFSRHADVDHVEPIGIHSVDLTPNDTYYQFGSPTFPYDQWHYHDMRGAISNSPYGIDADLAWNTEIGDPSIVVGIADTGIKYRHSDLGGNNPPGPADNDTQGNVWVNPFEIPGNGIDDEGNGFIDDVIGYDFVEAPIFPIGWTCGDVDCGVEENDPNDGEGHGTHVAGTVAAITNNARAVAGIAGGFSDGTTGGAGNGVKVMALRIGNRIVQGPNVSGAVTMANAAQAFNYMADMVDRGVNIAAVNCSWGSSNTGGILAALQNLQAHDVLVVVAAGNGNVTANTTNGNYLCTLPNVMTVGATDSTGVGASYSNFGANVDIAAPGSDIMSTLHVPTDTDTTHMYVGLSSGTSMAAPHVCGVTALIESYRSTLTALQKASFMVGNTRAFNPLNTKAIGPGIVNPNLALAAVAASPLGVDNPPLAARAGLSLRAYPNPAHVGTDLVVSARAGERVELRILDASGRLVQSMRGVADATGGIRLRWDGIASSGRRAGAGLYFVTAIANADRATSKLVVLE